MKNLITVLFSLLFISTLSFAQWSEQTSGVTTALESVSPVDNNIVWACGASGKVVLTINGGTNWIITTSPNSTLAFVNICGVDANTALVAGYLSTTTYVYKTTNAGANWTQVFTQTGGGFIDAIVLNNVNSNYGWMYGDPVGGRWSIWLTTNQGLTWDSTGFYIPQSGTEAGWNNAIGGWGTPGGVGFLWFGTNNSRIYQLRMGNGFTWAAQSTAGIPNIYSILFSDSLSGIAGGDAGMAFTSNGGANWVINTSSNGTGNITGIAVKSTEIWYSRGAALWYTSNNGSNWTSYTQPGTYYHLSRTKTASNLNIWAVRSTGGISKYTYPIGIRPISSEIPKNFVLYQNYPNPFNPVTNIKFDIPESSNITLTIYDAMGKVVTTLINEKLTPGLYEIKWDASNYSSGIYYYKIASEKFISTRKLVLVK